MPTTTFSTPGWHSFNVPNGVTSVTVDIKGAGGGGPDGGRGGRVQGKISVTGITTLRCLVGQGGSVGTGARTGGGGAAGQGHSNADGASGGGASLIRMNSTTGTVKAAAGGGGGQSGDSGDGGDGGTTTGEVGLQGNAGPSTGGNATGGTQSQGGEGGTSAIAPQFNGFDAADTVNGTAGKGGEASAGIPCHGGGGGGGGYRSGGGGSASSPGFAPGGGGGGGSNFVGGMTSATNTRGGGATAGNNGSIVITWTSPPPGNQPPSPPTAVKVNNVAESPGMATKDFGTVHIKATIDDPDAGDKVRLVVRRATKGRASGRFTEMDSFATFTDTNSGPYQAQGTVASVALTGIAKNTHYHLRLYTRDEHGKFSTTYNSVNFWANRTPNPPTLVSPPDNTTVSVLSSVLFDWTHSDPDPSDSQSGFQLQYRTAATALIPAGPWIRIDKPNETDGNWTLGAGTFRGNTFYEWRVRTKDEQGQLGVWADPFSFFVTSTSSPPRLVSPINDVAVDVHEDTTFQWRFVDPDQGDEQSKADLRYRVIGTVDWFEILGDVTTPGGDPFWVIPAETFTAGYHYEWQARTYDTISASQSDWSESESFWAINTPGSGLDTTIPDNTSVQGSLGCGVHQVYVYAQGGMQLLGEITPVSAGTYGRLRDDISTCSISVSGFGPDCGALLASLRCWMHEIVIFRSGVRVWEGPITLITHEVGSVQIEAKDAMAYVYRRIMRQGYNDSYRILQGEQVGLTSVVERARRIIVNALAPFDPNVLPYLTAFEFATDARQSRVVPDYSKTAWEEVDDLAATAGLDYTTIGRRIILWDTHRAIGKLPLMRDGDFSNPPIVTEYGMQLSNYFAVTNGTGVWGAAIPEGEADFEFPHYGPIELLASAYGESAAASEDVLTPAARLKLVETLEEQAERNIAGRWPTPLIVRVPDNSTLNPEVGIGFDQLIPGVHIPLRSDATLRSVAQWQKLDSVTVTFGPDGEKVAVVMSPAPQGGQDPDAEPEEL